MEANKNLVVKVAILFLAVAIGSSEALSGNDQGFCRMTKEGLNACAPSVTGVINAVPPSALCCSALSSADFNCLCFFKKYYSNLLISYGIDPNLAMQLPAKCNLRQSVLC